MSRSYGLTALGCTLAAVAVVVLVCFIIDPYKLYPSVPRLSPDRSVDLFYHLRLHKPHALARKQPDHLIAGSSRSARLPPARFPGDAYNVSLPGTTLREVRRAMEHAQAVKPLQSVVIGLDYYMFREGHAALQDHYEDARWLTPSADLGQRLRYRWQGFVDLWRSLLSVDALLDSWRALYGQDSSQRQFREDGTWDARAEVRVAPKRLYRMLARQKYADFRDKSDQLEFEELRRLLEFAVENDIRVRLLVSPMQGLLLQSVYLSGKWEQYLGWQRQLVDVAREFAPGVSIYGLEDQAALVLEPIEAPSPLFRDGVHYTQRAGEIILDCLLNPCAEDFEPRQLAPEFMDSYLQRVDKLRRDYLSAHPADVELLYRWLKLPPP